MTVPAGSWSRQVNVDSWFDLVSAPAAESASPPFAGATEHAALLLQGGAEAPQVRGRVEVAEVTHGDR